MARHAARLLAMVAYGALLAAPVAGQEMTGMWEIEFEGSSGLLEVPIEFEQAGTVLTGVADLLGADQRVAGTYEDGDLAFSIYLIFDGNELTLLFRGKVEGDMVEGSVTLPQGGDTPFTGMRNVELPEPQ